MKPEDLIACIKAQVEGKQIEFRLLRDPNAPWYKKSAEVDQWDTFRAEYHIAREPRKCWVKWFAYPHATAVECTIHEPTEPGWQLVVEEIN